jgi:hypothetical protein
MGPGFRRGANGLLARRAIAAGAGRDDLDDLPGAQHASALNERLGAGAVAEFTTAAGRAAG